MRVKHLWLVLALVAGMHWGGATLVWAQTTSGNHRGSNRGTDRMPDRLNLPPYVADDRLSVSYNMLRYNHHSNTQRNGKNR